MKRQQQMMSKEPADLRQKGKAGARLAAKPERQEPADARDRYRRERKPGPRGVSQTKRIVEHRK